jgi:hypothetical protein
MLSTTSYEQPVMAKTKDLQEVDQYDSVWVLEAWHFLNHFVLFRRTTNFFHSEKH